MSYLSTLELKVPPIVVMLLTGVLMFLASIATVQFSVDGPVMDIAGWAFGLVGLVVIFRGVQVFKRHQTTVDPRIPSASNQLVTNDIYGLTRNPMYLGMTLCLVGWGLYLGSIVALVFVAVFIAFITRFQICTEERLLARKFGKSYLEYAKDVRRWI
ncbi:methyltransferase family protein [Paraferrimonas haliotis]|nr:isoprenylcysteine carboxylmethyltransferase family protein [Paraferrimonas haliotis]